MIEVIHAAPRGTAAAKRVLTVACTERDSVEKKKKVERLTISFGEEDLEGTVQPHDDALVVTARISGFLVKRVMIDQGSGANVMYPDLFEGLGLKTQDLAKYDTSPVSFDGRVVIPEGQISLSVCSACPSCSLLHLTATTRHCLATCWFPLTLATPYSVGNFTFTWRVDGTAFIA